MILKIAITCAFLALAWFVFLLLGAVAVARSPRGYFRQKEGEFERELARREGEVRERIVRDLSKGKG